MARLPCCANHSSTGPSGPSGSQAAAAPVPLVTGKETHRCGCRELIKDQLIPRAVTWYTGAAVQDMDDEDEIDDDDEDDDDDDDDDEEDDEEVRCATDIVPMMLGSAASFGAGVGAILCSRAMTFAAPLLC